MAVDERQRWGKAWSGPRIVPDGDMEPSVGELFRELSDDATRLVRQEIALAKAEMRQTGRALAKDAAKIGIAVGMAALGAMAGVAFLILALGALIDSYWLSALIVSLALLGIAAVLAKNAKADLAERDLKPTRTMETLRADARWARHEVEEVKRELKS